MLDALLANFGQTYSGELGIDLTSKKPSELFKWLVASSLFGTRITETIAKNTYKVLEKHQLLTPQTILEADIWDLIKVMGEGGYVRYDGKTSEKLKKISYHVLEKYNGDLNRLHNLAKDSSDLERLVDEFYGIGPTTVNIFLRELRGIWGKANPPFSKFVKEAAQNLGIKDLRNYWKKNQIKGYTFVNFEAALLRLGKDWCHKGKCETCLMRKYCQK